MNKETCVLCGIEQRTDEMVKKSIWDFASEVTEFYYVCKDCNKEVVELDSLGSKELIAEIRKILKQHCKTLSITNSRGTAYGWMNIGSTLDRELNEEEKSVLKRFGLVYYHGSVITSIRPESLVNWLIRIKRKHIEITTNNKPKPTKKPSNNQTNGLTLKIKENGELASYIPKKVWYALYKQEIIVKKSGKWVVDLTKQEEIQIPIEIVEHSELKASKPKKKKQNNELQEFKKIVLESVEFANNEMKAWLENREENLPKFAIGEPADMMASLKGESTRLKSVDYVMYGSSGFCWIQFWNLNSYFGRMVRRWNKQEPDNVLGFQKGSSRYGHNLYPKINGTHTQITEQKAKAYRFFIDKLNELFKAKGIEIPSLYVQTHLT